MIPRIVEIRTGRKNTWILIGFLFYFICLFEQESFAQWTPTGLSAWTNFVFPTDSSILACTQTIGILASSDDGLTWTAMNNGLIYPGVRCVVQNDIYQFAGTEGGVFRSSDFGEHWTLINTGLPTGLPTGVIKTLAVLDTLLFAAIESYGVFVSTDNGTHWGATNSGLTNMMSRAFSSLNGYVFVGTYGGGVFRSNNRGATWAPVIEGLTNLYVSHLIAKQDYLFAGTLEGVFRSTNFGMSWVAVNSGLTRFNVAGLGTDGTNLFAGFVSLGSDQIFLSRNDGDTWVSRSEGLTDVLMVEAIALRGTYLFVATSDGVWRRPYSEITSMSMVLNKVPSEFNLEQNYPNPFNPSTTINYQLPTQSHVTLKVFDVLGREVAMLVNGVEKPGFKLVTFDASKLSSGIYYYRLQAGNYIETKKLLLLR